NANHPAVLGRGHVPWEMDGTIACGGTTVQTGEIIIGDDDGVVVVAPEMLVESIYAAYEQEQPDEWVYGQVRNDSTVHDILPPTGLSKADQAHQHVLRGITSGHYKPGDRLVLSTIAHELGMSVVPVREAIRRLQTDDLVQFERNVGATVTGIDPVEYRYTMETLALTEGYSTAQCAPLVTPQTLDKARGINEQMRALVAQDFAPEKFTELNEQFHSALFEHHQNPHILDLVHRGWNRLAAL